MNDGLNKNGSSKTDPNNRDTAIQTIVTPTSKDLGGFCVRRLLPASEMRSVGPFIFFDHMGPAHFDAGKGIDVRPHPHIGLATITYLFEGEVLHRDSLGNVQTIRPKELNWMTAGRGISHSERTPPELRGKEGGHQLHGLQLWIALPDEDEETEPFFIHYDSDAMPSKSETTGTIQVMVGEAYGLTSTVKTHSPTLYVEALMNKDATIDLPEHITERAVYIVSGALQFGDQAIPQHTMVVFESVPGIKLTATEDTRLVIVGGEPLGKRTMWWNLVASNKELLESAKQAWKDRTFPQVPEESEFIPLPE